MPPNAQGTGDGRNTTVNVSFPAHLRSVEEHQASQPGTRPSTAVAEALPRSAAAIPRAGSPDMGRRADAYEGVMMSAYADIASPCRSSPSRRRRPHGSPVVVARPPAMPTLLEELDLTDMQDCAGTPSQVRPLLAHEVQFLCSLHRAKRESSWFSRAVTSVLEACDRLVVRAQDERAGPWGGPAVQSPDVNPSLPGQALGGGSVEQNPSSSSPRLLANVA